MFFSLILSSDGFPDAKLQTHPILATLRLFRPGDALDSVFQQVVVGKQFLGLHPIFPAAPGSHAFTSALPALRDRRSGPPLGEVHEPSPGTKRGGRKGRATG